MGRVGSGIVISLEKGWLWTFLLSVIYPDFVDLLCVYGFVLGGHFCIYLPIIFVLSLAHILQSLAIS